MLNSVAHGRQQARKALIVQGAAVLVAGMLLFAAGPAWALAVWLGGGGLWLGSVLAAWLALGGSGVSAAGSAMGRLLAGMAFKWLALIAALLLGMAVWHLPPAGLVIGVVVALLAQLLVMLRR